MFSKPYMTICIYQPVACWINKLFSKMSENFENAEAGVLICLIFFQINI